MFIYWSRCSESEVSLEEVRAKLNKAWVLGSSPFKEWNRGQACIIVFSIPASRFFTLASVVRMISTLCTIQFSVEACR
jgi:hypothetical protein